MTRKCILLGLSAGLILSVAVLPVQADNEKGSAVIKGRVVFEGDPPPTRPLSIGGDQHCVASHSKPQPDQGTIVYKNNDNAIPYTFVYIKSGVKGKYDPPKEPVVLDQKDCMYHPHVWGMVAGQEIHIRNSDPTNHNVNSQAQKNPRFNFAQAQKGMVKELKGRETFNREEIMIKLKCDVHQWMASYCGVLTHPFFSVSKSHEDDGGDASKRGTFEIKNLPSGEYEVATWHPTFGELSEKVTIADGETKEVTFKYNAKKAEAPQAREVILSTETDDSKK